MKRSSSFRVFVALAVIAWLAVAIQAQILAERGGSGTRLVLLGLWIVLGLGYSVWAYRIRRSSASER